MWDSDDEDDEFRRVDDFGVDEADDDPDGVPEGDDDEDGEAGGKLFGPDGEPDWERGISDNTGVLRLWSNPEGEVDRVRLSVHWRDRFGRGLDERALKRHLEGALMQVLGMVNILLGPPELAPMPGEGIGERERPARPFSWAEFSRISDEVARLRARLDDLDEDEDRPGGPRTRGRSSNGKVRIELDEYGRYAGVDIDEEWLEEARVAQLIDAVPEAARDARARYQPPEREPSARDRLLAQVRDLNDDLSAMMKRGFA